MFTGPADQKEYTGVDENGSPIWPMGYQREFVKKVRRQWGDLLDEAKCYTDVPADGDCFYHCVGLFQDKKFLDIRYSAIDLCFTHCLLSTC